MTVPGIRRAEPSDTRGIGDGDGDGDGSVNEERQPDVRYAWRPTP